MSKSVAYKHYLRVLSRWPKDPLRPECQFQDAMQRRIERRFIPKAPGAVKVQAGEGKDATGSVEDKGKVVAVGVGGVVDEKVELEQVNAIYSLLENRYRGKYPIAGNLLKPTSNPTHYTDLIKELQEAPTRSWWGNFTNRWKGFLRFQ